MTFITVGANDFQRQADSAYYQLPRIPTGLVAVWVRRALAECYFPAQKTPANRVLLEWAQGYFG